MRIALVSTPFVEVPPRRYGGTELVVHELAEGLIERGHDVTLFATGDSSTGAELRSLYPVAQWPPDPLTDLNHVSWALREAAEGGFDVIHAHSAVALGLGKLLPRGLPLVYTIHHHRDERLSRFYEAFPEPYYIAISRDQCRREIPLPRVTVIHHGLDPSRYQWTDTAHDYVCFLGRLAPVKGPHTAMDVARDAGVPIRVAGEVHSVDVDFSDEEVRPRLALPHVSFLGAVGNDVKVPLLRSARALLAPIEWNEPFGLAFAEAMLSGCPVVAYPRGSLRELVEEGVTGFLVQNAREMAEVVRPGGPLDDFDRGRCRRRAEARFGRARMTDAHVELYERVRADREFRMAPASSPSQLAAIASLSERDAPPSGPILERRRRPRTPRRRRRETESPGPSTGPTT